jgi:excisionase family DNA binding protein
MTSAKTITLRQRTSIEELTSLLRATEELVQRLRMALQSFPKADSVHRPFHSSFRAEPGEKLKRSQRLAVSWRDGLQTRNTALRDYFVLQNRQQALELFPLSSYGATPNFGYSLTASDCIEKLEREVLLLEDELSQRQSVGPAQADATETNPAEPGADTPSEGDELERRPLVTARVAAERLGLTLQRVYELARTKQLPAVRFGKQVRFDPAVLEDFITRGGNLR